MLLNVIFGKRIELSILAKLASYSHITNKHVKCVCVWVYEYIHACVYVYIYVYISLSPKTVQVTCIDLVVLIVTCSSLRVSQRLLILIMKNHGRCVNISIDHLKHSGRNFNYGHSTVLCTCIHVILNKDVHQKKKYIKTHHIQITQCLVEEDSIYVRV